MARKVYVEAKVQLIVTLEDEVTVEDALEQIEVNLPKNFNGNLEDFNFLSHEIKDSK